MKADIKNATYKGGEQAKIGDLVLVTVVTSTKEVQHFKGLVVAINAEQEQNNGRVVFEKAIHTLPAFTIPQMELLERANDESGEGGNENEGSGSVDGLRNDGPTFAEFIAAGYKAEDYPPQGYAEKLTEEEQAAAKKAVEKLRKKVQE